MSVGPLIDASGSWCGVTVRGVGKMSLADWSMVHAERSRPRPTPWRVLSDRLGVVEADLPRRFLRAGDPLRWANHTRQLRRARGAQVSSDVARRAASSRDRARFWPVAPLGLENRREDGAPQAQQRSPARLVVAGRHRSASAHDRARQHGPRDRRGAWKVSQCGDRAGLAAGTDAPARKAAVPSTGGPRPPTGASGLKQDTDPKRAEHHRDAGETPNDPRNGPQPGRGLSRRVRRRPQGHPVSRHRDRDAPRCARASRGKRARRDGS